MARLRHALVANLAGQGWAVAINLLFVPFFVHSLGIERYAIIALLPVAVGLLQVLDGGLALTLNREMAAAAGTENASRTRSAAFTLQTLHLGAGIVVGVVVLSLGPSLATHWLTPTAMSGTELAGAIRMMAVTIVLQWPVVLFQNGLMGLGLQWRANLMLAAYATFANVGAWFLFSSYGATLWGYFAWLGVCSATHSVIAALAFWHSLPSGARAKFDRTEISRFWRFSAGVGAIGMTGVLLLFADRLLASRLLTLEQFGYYGLATTIGRSIYLLIAPIFSAVFPRFAALVGRRDAVGLETLYSTSTQLMAVAILPPTVVLAWIGYDAALLWLGQPDASAPVAAIARWIVIGSALNGLMNLPYALQLASGLTRLGLSLNLFLLLIAAPLGIVLGGSFGAPGIGATWFFINAVYLLVGLPLTHRLTHIGRTRRWVARDVAPAAIASIGGTAAVASLMAPGTARLDSALHLAFALGVAYLLAALTTPQVRQTIRAMTKRRQ